jgi:hypothetical protein
VLSFGYRSDPIKQRHPVGDFKTLTVRFNFELKRTCKVHWGIVNCTNYDCANNDSSTNFFEIAIVQQKNFDCSNRINHFFNSFCV